jgi:agmatinase
MPQSVPFNFAGLAETASAYDHSSIVILPVAFDKTSTWMRGSRHGPRAIIDASRNMELYDMELDAELHTLGIHTDRPLKARNAESLIRKVYKRVQEHMNRGKRIVVLGGEHTVALGSIFAHAERYRHLSVLHLDAHADARDDYEGDRFNHACVMARVREKTDRIISVGIRSMDLSEREAAPDTKMIRADDIDPGNRWLSRVCGALTDTVYITLDLDVLDPAIMPATGTPEPGGLLWDQMLRLLREVARHHTIVGFDVVELCPGINKAPDYLAAKLVYKLIGYAFFNSG